MSGGHGHVESSNKNIAKLIAFLAALLAICEMGAKISQTEALTQHVDATNMRMFFQARTIRQTVMRTAADEAEAQYKGPGNPPPAVKAQVEHWRGTARRHETEPETIEGRKELMACAKAHEAKRETARAAYRMLEFGSAACQLAVVLASAAAVTSVIWLAFVTGGLGRAGAALTALGFFAPTLVHL